MKRIIFGGILVSLLGMNSNAAFSRQPQIINVQGRKSMTLNGYWKYLVDPYQSGYYDYRLNVRDQQAYQNRSEAVYLGYQAQDPSERVEYDFDRADDLIVPRDWNSQKEKLFYYEGAVWYYRKFDYQPPENGDRLFIHFGAANYRAHVYLNGEKLGTHIGGFTPFNFEITGKVRPKGNFVIVMVDNTRGMDEVPTVNTDWWNYGGLTRDVSIIDVPETFIQDYFIQLSPDDRDRIDVSVTLNGKNKAGQTVRIEIPEAKIKAVCTTDDQGVAASRVRVKNLKLWNPEKPYLYDVNLIHQNHILTDRIGFRTLKTEGTEILVNGKPVFLRGICIHEENPVRGGRACSREDARMLLGWARELGCNFVRLAHYPHSEYMAKVADEMGIMVWSEVPVYWTIQWQNEDTYNNAASQLEDMIARDKNRASVIIWSVANETPVSPERTAFLKKMIYRARSMDPVRLVSAALERHTKPGTKGTQVIEDPLQEYVDVISFNQYIGWYDGLPDKLKEAVFDIGYGKPVIVSEFGAGALQGNHGSRDARWTEEFQEYLYEETVKMLERIPQLRGVTPWILTDFRSPRRLLSGIQDGWNRKGLISQTGDKKKAFYVLRDYYKMKEKQFGR
ncbi:beta-glucuronidase [bacterium]|nr:beta-glucuronidase [bacterium]